jgi:putative ABC transport system ATP-binding protein
VPELTLANVRLAYGEEEERVQALRGVTLAPPTGCFTLLVGPSGSGKTSLLTVMGCIVSPDQGSVRINGIEVTGMSEAKRAEIRLASIGFVFQAFRLMRSLTAEENVALALCIRGSNTASALKGARALLDEFGLLPKARLRPDHLSGGEKQRVAIVRALIGDPEILLADEPTASLDSENGLQVAALLRRIAEERGRIVVVVSHDERLMPFAHNTVNMRDGQIVGVTS